MIHEQREREREREKKKHPKINDRFKYFFQLNTQSLHTVEAEKRSPNKVFPQLQTWQPLLGLRVSVFFYKMGSE